MAIKKKSKVSAEFNMSSLTDIIFLLLIFFMLTSSMIVPNALNLQLPGKKKSSSRPKQPPTTIDIKSSGALLFNGTQMSAAQVERKIIELRKSRGNKAAVSITPDKKAKNDDFVRVLDMAHRHAIKTVLNDPR